MAPTHSIISEKMRMRIKVWAMRCASGYRNAALLLLNTVAAFALLNLIVWGALALWTKAANLCGHGVVKPDSALAQKLRTVYPDYDLPTILALRQETASRTLTYEEYIHFKESPFAGRFVTVSEAGFRENRTRKCWPPDKNVLNIFLFGGSTTFGYGVPDEHTIASFLEEYLNRQSPSLPVRVYNFGQGYYYSSQEAVLFMRMLARGDIPHVALFVDGLNDFLTPTDDPFFNNQFDEAFNNSNNQQNVSCMIRNLAANLPVWKGVERAKAYFSGTSVFGSGEAQAAQSSSADPRIVDNIISRYFANKRIIEGAGNRFGVKTIFVWQPVPNYKYDLAHHLFPEPILAESRFAYTRDGYLHLRQDLDRQPADRNFIWAADIQEQLAEPLYVDFIHYRAEFMKFFADYIGSEIQKRGLVALR